MNASDKARQFLEHEQAFRLGRLPTEQPHPLTRGLAETLARDTAAGVAMLFAVDRELPGVVKQVLASEKFDRLVAALGQTLAQGGRIFVTGCGATGRLAILLEACWRHFWQRVARKLGRYGQMQERVVSVMAGGDFALIRSVEGFEDFTAFGRQQIGEAGLTRADCVVAITEGGETSFVIGTAQQAVAVGAQTFFVYNNPTEVLVAQVERSRQIIENPAVCALDLHSGPMAIAGSTRMQATTVELAVVGAAMELALGPWLKATLNEQDKRELGWPVQTAETYGRLFEQLINQISTGAAVSTVASLANFEAAVYRHNGLVTYFAHEYLLDILTDTTERSPTFSLPPFRPRGDKTSAVSWAFVKTPILSTEAAWAHVLGREPRGLDWDRQTYARMEAPRELQDDPPRLDQQTLSRFAIGCEPDASRTAAPESAAIAVLVGAEAADAETDAPRWRASASDNADYAQSAILSVGAELTSLRNQTQHYYHVPCTLARTPLDLWSHLAIKLVMNNLSTATMGLLERLVGNWMVHVNTSNKKLIDRGIRLIADQTPLSYEQACYALFETLEQQRTGARAGASPVAATIARVRRTSFQ